MLFYLFYHKSETASALKIITNNLSYHLKNLVTRISMILHKF